MNRHILTVIIAIGVLVLAGCDKAGKDTAPGDSNEARAVVTIDQDSASQDKTAGVACIAGNRVEVEVEITGNTRPQGSDSIAVEAYCDQAQVATAIATAQPPSGFDANRANGTQVTGQARCTALPAVQPSPNPAVWKAVCKFF